MKNQGKQRNSERVEWSKQRNQKTQMVVGGDFVSLCFSWRMRPAARLCVVRNQRSVDRAVSFLEKLIKSLTGINVMKGKSPLRLALQKGNSQRRFLFQEILY